MEELVKGIVFDLDGAVVDSLPDIHAASSEMLKSINLEPLPSKQVRSFIGNGVDKLIKHKRNSKLLTKKIEQTGVQILNVTLKEIRLILRNNEIK